MKININETLYERVKEDFLSLLEKDDLWDMIIKSKFFSEKEKDCYEYACYNEEGCDRIFSHLWDFNSHLLCYDMKECLHDYIDSLEERAFYE